VISLRPTAGAPLLTVNEAPGEKNASTVQPVMVVPTVLANNAQANQARALEARALRELHLFCPCEGDWRAISFYWLGLTACFSEEQFPPVEPQHPLRPRPECPRTNTSPILTKESIRVVHMALMRTQKEGRHVAG
jgi:hypothetical protein